MVEAVKNGIGDQTRGEQSPGQHAQGGRWLCRYSIDGDLRFISHHDTIRLFQRALARAGLPVRYSAGYNPHPRLSIPLPRPVGIASDAEIIMVEMAQSIDPTDALRQLREQSPAGLKIHEVRQLEPGVRPSTFQVVYRIEPADPPVPDLAIRAQRMLEASEITVERRNEKTQSVQIIDIRPYIVDVAWDDQGVLMTLRVTPRGTARPAEVAQQLGYPHGPINHRTRRLEIQWQ